MTVKAHEKEPDALKADMACLCGDIAGSAAGEMKFARHERPPGFILKIPAQLLYQVESQDN